MDATADAPAIPVESIMDYIDAQRLERDYCCSQCYNRLTTEPMPGSVHQCHVVCVYCDTWSGIVRKSTAERRINTAAAQADEARAALAAAVPWMKATMPKRSEADLLKAMGF